MSRENPNFKEKLLKKDILSTIACVFKVFMTNCEVLRQVVMLLGTLAMDYPLVTHQCVIEDVHLSLLNILRECKTFNSLLSVTIETLGKKGK